MIGPFYSNDKRWQMAQSEDDIHQRYIILYRVIFLALCQKICYWHVYIFWNENSNRQKSCSTNMVQGQWKHSISKPVTWSKFVGHLIYCNVTLHLFLWILHSFIFSMKIKSCKYILYVCMYGKTLKSWRSKQIC